jgi:hypothetical protein
MADKILHKRSLTLGSVPTTSSLLIGEIALNVPDGKLFLRQSGSVDKIITVGESASFASTASFVQTAQTASYVLQAVSASFATSASTVPASGVVGLNLSQIATGSVTASVSPTQFTVTSGSSTELTVRGTGVTIGSVITDTHTITGSLNISGSATAVSFSGSFTGSLTGSLFGTATSASFATTASYALFVEGNIRRSDYTSSLDPNINLLYLGEAPNGSSESTNVWTISQLSISSSGATVTRTTSSAAWGHRIHNS